MTLDDIKSNFSQILISLRKAKNLTQIKLAEKLNYSDKAISKWEVGAVLPDVQTLSHIAEFFEITVNDLIYSKQAKIKKQSSNRLLITLLSYCLVWFIATCIYFVLESALYVDIIWWCFIYAIPVGFIVLLVFSVMWFSKFWQFLTTTGLFWGILVSIYISFIAHNLWFIFIVGVVGEILIVLWYLMKGFKKNKSKN